MAYLIAVRAHLVKNFLSKIRMTKLTNDQIKSVNDMIEKANKTFEDKIIKDLENRIDRLETINSSKEDEIADLKANLTTL